MSNPFGMSNQGGYQGPSMNMQQPTPQNFGGGQGFGGGFGGFGGFQPQGFGFGGGFNPFQGGFGGGFQPQGFGGFGGGFNPMFGGIGGLGFNPIMGPMFGMPMQGFGGFNPYQPEMLSARDPYRANESGMPMPGPTGRESFDNPRMVQPQQADQNLVNQFINTSGQYNNRGGARTFDPNFGAPMQSMRSAESIAQNPSSSQNFGAPMYGGIGGLGFNPMMGPQFGMPMTRDVAFSQGMLTPQQRQQLFAAQDQQRQTENDQREALKGKFGAGIFEGEGRGGGLRFREDYKESPELSAFTKTPEYQQAMRQDVSYASSGPSRVDRAFKDWLYKNKDTLSGGALGFMTEATKAQNAARDAETARRFGLTPEQRMAEDEEMHGRMSADVHKYLQSRGMQTLAASQQPDFANTQAALNAARMQYGY